jgi:hypothetical protein
MAQTKWCCRIFPVVLILISAIIAAGIWYFDENAHTFAFLSSRDEFITYLGATLSIALIPIGIFYLLNDREKYASRARLLALLGFLPALGFLVFLIA